MRKAIQLLLILTLPIFMIGNISCGSDDVEIVDPDKDKDDDKDKDGDEDPDPAEPASIELILIGEVGENEFSIKFVPNQHTASYKYALGGAGQEKKFADGEMQNIVEIEGKEDKIVRFDNLDQNTIYTVYAQPINEDEIPGEVVILELETEADHPVIKYDIKNVTVSGLELTMRPNKYCGEYYVSTMLKESYEPLLNQYGEGDVELLLMILELFDQAYLYDREIETTLRLAARCSTTNLLIILPYDNDGEYDPDLVQLIDIETPEYIPDAPEAKMTVTYSNVTSTNAITTFTPGENCTGFYYNMFETVSYNKHVQEGVIKAKLIEEDYFSPIEVIFDWDDYLDPGESYTVAGLPVNVNGLEGLGDVVAVEFKTLNTRGTNSYKIEIPGRILKNHRHNDRPVPFK